MKTCVSVCSLKDKIKKKKFVHEKKSHHYFDHNSVLDILSCVFGCTSVRVCVCTSMYVAIYNVYVACASPPCTNILPHIPWLHSMGDDVSQGDIIIRSVHCD